jgi:hypothetical protein
MIVVNDLVYNPGGPPSPGGGFTYYPLVGEVTTNFSGGTPFGPTYASFIGNVIKNGPTTEPTKLYYLLDGPVSGSQYYVTDNVQVNGSGFFFNVQSAGWAQVGSPPVALPNPLTILPSSQVESWVLGHAGARATDRDAVDTRIVSDVANITGQVIDYTIHYPTGNVTELDYGGFPTLAQNTRVLTVPANYADLRPSGYTVLEEDILFPLAAQVEGP